METEVWKRKYGNGSMEMEVWKRKYGNRSMETEVWKPKYGNRLWVFSALLTHEFALHVCQKVTLLCDVRAGS